MAATVKPTLLVVLAATWAGSPVRAATHELTVIKGSGSGSYEESSVVHIWANPYDTTDPSVAKLEPPDPDAPLRIFDRWGGDTSSLADVFAPETTLVMPLNDIAVSALYKDAPRWTPPTVWSYFPDSHVGVVFLFHGGRGSAGTLMNRTEVRTLIDGATARGYGVVGIDSYDRRIDGENWNKDQDPASNLDMQRVAAVRSDLITRGKMGADDPVYFYGASGGGIFVSLFDQEAQPALGIPIAATAVMISSGDVEVLSTSTVPTMFALAENDTASGGPNPAAFLAHAYLLGNGVPTRYRVSPASPVHAERFWGIEGLSRTDSEVIQGALQAAGLLGPAGYLLQSPDESDWQSAVPAAYEGYLTHIEDQLLVCFAEHKIYSHLDYEIFDFFAAPTSSPTDTDGDGEFDINDNCPLDPNPTQSNADADFPGDACDNCPDVANSEQLDFDLDLLGDACESGVALADVNHSQRVDGFDLAQFARGFGAGCADAAYDPAVDFSRDCLVDGDDLVLLAQYFGQSVP